VTILNGLDLRLDHGKVGEKAKICLPPAIGARITVCQRNTGQLANAIDVPEYWMKCLKISSTQRRAGVN